MSRSERDPVERTLEALSREHPGIERVLYWYRPDKEARPLVRDYIDTLDAAEGELVIRYEGAGATYLVRGHPDDPYERVVCPNSGDVEDFRSAWGRAGVQGLLEAHRADIELVHFDTVREVFETTPEFLDTPAETEVES